MRHYLTSLHPDDHLARCFRLVVQALDCDLEAFLSDFRELLNLAIL